MSDFMLLFATHQVKAFWLSSQYLNPPIHSADPFPVTPVQTLFSKTLCWLLKQSDPLVRSIPLLARVSPARLSLKQLARYFGSSSRMDQRGAILSLVSKSARYGTEHLLFCKSSSRSITTTERHLSRRC